ncbi:hypothetical protein M758_9G035800 [Ceratodon purpureus]|nr:hypothetical protein M758_9G035800 [Ceratodon purpureus]
MAVDGEWRSSVLVGKELAAAMAWNSRGNTRRLQILLFSLFVFSHSFAPLPSASAGTLWSDVNALHGLVQGWNATPGLSQNWTWGSDPCLNNWTGVSCFQESVTSLRLDQFGIIGTLSPSIGQLKNLQFLNLQNNPGLTGPIPKEIGQLRRLYALDLSNCSLSGRIPRGLGNLRNASYIYLKRNQLVGEIPYTLGYLSKAFEISLGRNNLSGSIPVSSPKGFPVGFNNLTSLLILDLSWNSFVGPPPQFLLQLPLVNKLNLSLNQFTGVFDGGMRTSGHVNAYMINNNITAVINLPSPFIDPKLGGNPICENQSFPFPDICSYSGRLTGPNTWQQPISCSNKCDQNAVVHPATCNCSYPYICNMFFAWTATYGLDGARIGHLRRTLASGLNVSAENLWIENATYQNQTVSELKAKVLLYPPAGAQKWDRSQVTLIESELVNKTIKLPDYEPYGLVSSNLQTSPLNEGSSGPITSKNTNHQSLPIIAGIIGAFVALMFLSSLLICFIKRRRTPDYNLDNASEIFDLNPDHHPSCLFSYDEVRSATRSFHRGNKIGEGAFGPVYKGTMRDGSEVAVKELPSNIKQCNRDFLNEVELISVLQHKNLVKLRGCGIRGNSRLLVYEYVENKCLAQALFGPKAILLEWPIRYNIALGMAKGLSYLHSRGPTRLAHGDIKASNILLDRNMEPKIADFGLARMCQNNERKVLTRIEGKRGYVAPEYARYGQLTPKTDVFSFGIIALELVSGRESMNQKLPAEEQYLLSWAWNLYEQRRVMDLVDPKVREGCDEEQALLLIKVALLCSQGEASSRPHMVRVVSLLSGDADVPDIPQRPEFLGLGLTDPNKAKLRGTALTTW